MESGGEEDDAFTMGEREWQKMNRNMSKQGYRDGKNEGREKGRQVSFEKATTLGFQHSLKLGQILGVIQWKLSQSSLKDQKDTLEALQDRVMGQLGTIKDITSSSTPEGNDYGGNVAFLQMIAEELLAVDSGLTSTITKLLQD